MSYNGVYLGPYKGSTKIVYFLTLEFSEILFLMIRYWTKWKYIFDFAYKLWSKKISKIIQKYFHLIVRSICVFCYDVVEWSGWVKLLNAYTRNPKLSKTCRKPQCTVWVLTKILFVILFSNHDLIFLRLFSGISNELFNGSND